jgi:hypothetical protein
VWPLVNETQFKHFLPLLLNEVRSFRLQSPSCDDSFWLLRNAVCAGHHAFVCCLNKFHRPPDVFDLSSLHSLRSTPSAPFR